MPRRAPRLAAGRARALGLPTRGTTNPNRLRRMDRWIVAELGARLRLSPSPLVVDLGYGASPVTTLELADRLGAAVPGVRVLGLELDPVRVQAALPSADPPRLRFAHGGFELAGSRPSLVRAANVLRQYDEPAARRAWDTMLGALAEGGLLVEGTCDELGRRGAWVLLDPTGPLTLTLACHPDHIERPSDLAERLPKALIHRNVPGEGVHALLQAMDAAWAAASPVSTFGRRQQWAAMVEALRPEWPVSGRTRPGELTVAWSAVG